MIKIILIAAASFPPFNRSENKGDVIECEQELAEDLMDAGLAELWAEPKEQAPTAKQQAPTAQDTDAQAPEANKEQTAPANEPANPAEETTEPAATKKASKKA